MSRFAARGDMAAFGRTVDTGIRQIGFLLIPAGLVSAVLAEPITRLVYERGEFTPDQTPVVAGALAAFSVGLVFNGWMLLLNRAFYGLQANWIPTLVALGNLALNVVLFAALYRVGVWGLPLAVSLSNLAGAVALAILMWRRIGGVEAASTLTALTRIIVASVVASALAVGIWWASMRQSAARRSGRSCPSASGSVWGRSATSESPGCSASGSSARCSRCAAASETGLG